MSEIPNKDRWKTSEVWAAWVIPFIFIVWSIIVLQSGRNVNITGVEWNFSRTALLGDSFGVIGGVMATAAATFTYLTLQRERAETFRLRERENDRDKAESNREAEATFFRLLELRNSILNRIEYSDRYNPSKNSQGPRAVKELIQPLIYTGAKIHIYDSAQDLYSQSWEDVEDQFGHYLRFTYHILRFIDERFSNELQRYEYTRLLRSQLSNPEVELIALNSMYGAGSPKMANYVVKYALLHSLPEATVEELELVVGFGPEAFDTSRWEAQRQAREMERLSKI